MFIKFPQERYTELINLYSKSSFINSARSHLERTPIKKEVYVNDLDNPKTAAIIVKHRIFLGGNSNDSEFNQSLYYHFIKRRKELEKRGIYDLDFYISSEDWIERLQSIFPDSFPYSRCYYEINELRDDNWKEKIPDGFTLHPVDLTLLNNSHLKNYDWIIEEIEENWLPFEKNLIENRGFYLVHNNEEIVSWCTTEYLTEEDDIEVGIATRSDFRKKGLASIVGSATAEYTLSKYKSTGWHCSASNIGSCRTAEKVGFKLKKKYQKLGWFFNQIDNFILTGYENFRKKEYHEAIKFYNKVIEAQKNEDEAFKTSAYLNKWGFTFDKLVMELATFYSIAGNEEKTIEMIQKAIELGFGDIDYFEKQEHFKFLQNKDIWEKFKQGILANKGEKTVI